MGKTTLPIDFGKTSERLYWGFVMSEGMLPGALFVPVPGDELTGSDYLELVKHSRQLCGCGSRRLAVPSAERRLRSRGSMELGSRFTCLGPANGDPRSAFVGLAVQRGQLAIKPLFTTKRGWPYQQLLDLTTGNVLPSDGNAVLLRPRIMRYPFTLGVRMEDVDVPVCLIDRSRAGYRIQLAPFISEPFQHTPHHCGR